MNRYTLAMVIGGAFVGCFLMAAVVAWWTTRGLQHRG
jgi:hypothetical protein